ncbi:893_t:CDS:1, partial [Scutellospora calospora]
KMAKNYLSMQRTSNSSELVFSLITHTVTKIRNSLAPDLVCAALYLKS